MSTTGASAIRLWPLFLIPHSTKPHPPVPATHLLPAGPYQMGTDLFFMPDGGHIPRVVFDFLLRGKLRIAGG